MGKGIAIYQPTGVYDKGTGEEKIYQRFLSNEKSAKRAYKGSSWIEKTAMIRGMVFYLFNKINAQKAN